MTDEEDETVDWPACELCGDYDRVERDDLGLRCATCRYEGRA